MASINDIVKTAKDFNKSSDLGKEGNVTLGLSNDPNDAAAYPVDNSQLPGDNVQLPEKKGRTRANSTLFSKPDIDAYLGDINNADIYPSGQPSVVGYGVAGVPTVAPTGLKFPLGLSYKIRKAHAIAKVNERAQKEAAATQKQELLDLDNPLANVPFHEAQTNFYLGIYDMAGQLADKEHIPIQEAMSRIQSSPEYQKTITTINAVKDGYNAMYKTATSIYEGKEDEKRYVSPLSKRLSADVYLAQDEMPFIFTNDDTLERIKWNMLALKTSIGIDQVIKKHLDNLGQTEVSWVQQVNSGRAKVDKNVVKNIKSQFVKKQGNGYVFDDKAATTWAEEVYDQEYEGEPNAPDKDFFVKSMKLALTKTDATKLQYHNEPGGGLEFSNSFGYGSGKDWTPYHSVPMKNIQHNGLFDPNAVVNSVESWQLPNTKSNTLKNGQNVSFESIHIVPIITKVPESIIKNLYPDVVNPSTFINSPLDINRISVEDFVAKGGKIEYKPFVSYSVDAKVSKDEFARDMTSVRKSYLGEYNDYLRGGLINSKLWGEHNDELLQNKLKELNKNVIQLENEYDPMQLNVPNKNANQSKSVANPPARSEQPGGTGNTRKEFDVLF